jgi:hypothetical protein
VREVREVREVPEVPEVPDVEHPETAALRSERACASPIAAAGRPLASNLTTARSVELAIP